MDDDPRCHWSRSFDSSDDYFSTTMVLCIASAQKIYYTNTITCDAANKQQLQIPGSRYWRYFATAQACLVVSVAVKQVQFRTKLS